MADTRACRMAWGARPSAFRGGGARNGCTADGRPADTLVPPSVRQRRLLCPGRQKRPSRHSHGRKTLDRAGWEACAPAHHRGLSLTEKRGITVVTVNRVCGPDGGHRAWKAPRLISFRVRKRKKWRTAQHKPPQAGRAGRSHEAGNSLSSASNRGTGAQMPQRTAKPGAVPYGAALGKEQVPQGPDSRSYPGAMPQGAVPPPGAVPHGAAPLPKPGVA